MRIRFAHSTGCPHGQFVVEADDDVERAILAAFLGADPAQWQFTRHGQSYDQPANGPRAFNFGWRKVAAPSNEP